MVIVKGYGRGDSAIGQDISRLKRDSRDGPAVAKVYDRLTAVFDDVMVVSGAAISLINVGRTFSDIDVVSKGIKLNGKLLERLKENGFRITIVNGNVVYQLVDEKTEIVVETMNNGSLLYHGRVINDLEIATLLGCSKYGENVMVGFPKPLLFKHTITIPISTNENGNAVDVKVPIPLYQIGIKYNIWRLRKESKDMEDMRILVGHYYGSVADFFKAERNGIRVNSKYLGIEFEQDLTRLLHE